MVFEMKHITKTYDTVVANDDVSLHLNRGAGEGRKRIRRAGRCSPPRSAAW